MITVKPLEWYPCGNTGCIASSMSVDVGLKLIIDIRYFIEPTKNGYDAILMFKIETNYEHFDTIEEAKAYCDQENQKFWQEVYERMLSNVITITALPNIEKRGEIMKLIDANHLVFNAENERYATMREIANEPKVDPVHAAGACYCKECKHCFYDEINKHNYCNRPLGLIGYSIVRGDDFCSHGEKKN